MKISELLLEKTLIKKKWKVDKVSVKKGINLLNAHCKNSLADIASGRILWRGMNNIGDVAALDSTSTYRTSRDSNNIYQLLMEVSASMKNVPPRTRSFICSSDFSTADTYGASAYAIFPYDGTTIAQSEVDDFFTTGTNNGYTELSDLSAAYGDYLEQLKIKPDEGSKFINAARLDQELAKHSAEIVFLMGALAAGFLTHEQRATLVKAYNARSKHKVGLIWDIIPSYAKKKLDEKAFAAALGSVITLAVGKKYYKLAVAQPSKRFTNLGSVLMSPRALGIKLSVPGSIKADRDVECWFSGKCIAIKKDVFVAIVKEMQKRKMKVGSRILDALKDYLYDDDDDDWR